MNYDHLLRADVTYREVKATLAKHTAGTGAKERDIRRCARLLQWKIQDVLQPKDMSVSAGGLRVEWEVSAISIGKVEA